VVIDAAFFGITSESFFFPPINLPTVGFPPSPNASAQQRPHAERSVMAVENSNRVAGQVKRFGSGMALISD
jgi:hypothetical protein